MASSISRRDFLILSAKGAGAAVISYGLMGCVNEDDESQNTEISVQFAHGVASGDPLSDAIILWTRVTPSLDGELTVSWEIAQDEAFDTLIGSGNTTTNTEKDYTIKVDAIGLSAGTTYYYRFICNGITSTVGKTKTLVDGSPSAVKLAVMSCANYPTGHFNVYNLVAQQADLDAVLHLGDYIYEYARGEYGSDNAEELDRQFLPATELLSLSDYRTRYAQYRSDENLQLLHQRVPFITVWDDHEVANDTWREGAENHSEDESSFEERKLAALQAYFEWLPIRPWSEGNYEEIYRSFAFGDLVDLHMLDTRVLARDEQLAFSDYFDATTNTFDQQAYNDALYDSERTMLGNEQLQWLEDKITNSTGRWQVLGQQVLMAEMKLPGAVALNIMTTEGYVELGTLAALAARYAADNEDLSEDELTTLTNNADKLTDEVLAQLALPALPYNLDAWDGYAGERDKILDIFNNAAKDFVVLAGDTHNAWASELTDSEGNNIGCELATSSVTSPGLEYYLGLTDETAIATEAGLVSLIDGLKYTNLTDRGFLTVTFTQQETQATWHFVDTILSTQYTELTSRQQVASIAYGVPALVFNETSS